MIQDILVWIAAIIFVEAVVQIITTSKFFFSLRNFIYKKSKFFGDLIKCGYCMSVWVPIPIGWALPGSIFRYLFVDNLLFTIIDGIILVIILHRLSNIWHERLSRWFDRVPWHFVFEKIESVQAVEGEIDDDEGA